MHMDWSPVLISMKTASLSIFITFFLGVLAAWAVVSMRSRRLKMFCDGILTLPLVLPPTVAGFFLLYLFGVKRPLGQFSLCSRHSYLQTQLFLVYAYHITSSRRKSTSKETF